MAIPNIYIENRLSQGFQGFAVMANNTFQPKDRIFAAEECRSFLEVTTLTCVSRWWFEPSGDKIVVVAPNFCNKLFGFEQVRTPQNAQYLMKTDQSCWGSTGLKQAPSVLLQQSSKPFSKKIRTDFGNTPQLPQNTNMKRSPS